MQEMNGDSKIYLRGARTKRTPKLRGIKFGQKKSAFKRLLTYNKNNFYINRSFIFDQFDKTLGRICVCFANPFSEVC